MASVDRGAEPRGLVVETRELSFAYDGRPVLDRVTLRAEPGEVVGLLGPNGSGKSTLIKLLSGVLEPGSGSVLVGEMPIETLPRRELARRLAVVPQEPTFAFSFTALEIVLMGRHPHLAGLSFESAADVELASAALQRCAADELAEREIHELSAGERQRVVFARALAQQPRVLLLDEPASFLDIRHQVEIYDIVRELAVERRCSVLTVMHDLNLAAEYCDRIYLLRDGRVEADGPTAEVFTYANLTRVFDTDVWVDTHALTGGLLVLPLSGRARDRLKEDGKH
jgi:iron complex transport system ATP-binding protein